MMLSFWSLLLVGIPLVAGILALDISFCRIWGIPCIWGTALLEDNPPGLVVVDAEEDL